MNKKEFTKTYIDSKYGIVISNYPKYRKPYFFLNIYGELWEERWLGNCYDKKRFAIGNYFETKKEAEFEAERLKVITELKRFAEPKNSVWDCKNEHWFIFYDFVENRINYHKHLTVKNSEIYFLSKFDAINAVQHVGKDRVKKYYLGVEE